MLWKKKCFHLFSEFCVTKGDEKQKKKQILCIVKVIFNNFERLNTQNKIHSIHFQFIQNMHLIRNNTPHNQCMLVEYKNKHFSSLIFPSLLKDFPSMRKRHLFFAWKLKKNFFTKICIHWGILTIFTDQYIVPTI